MKRQIIAISLLCIINVILWVIRSILVSNLYFSGLDYLTIETKLNEAKKENKLLKEEYLKKTSYSTIYREAKKQGFVSAHYISY